MRNVYTLLDREEWKPCEPKLTRPAVLSYAHTNNTNKSILSTNVDNMEKAKKENKNIQDLIEMFRPVNPTVNRLFPNTTQRKAIKNLLNIYGREKLEKIIAILPKSNAMPYAPVITTPTQLEAKVGQLEAFVQKYRAELNKNKNTVFKV